MSQTKAQRKKQQRTLGKRKEARRLNNIRKALPADRYRLDVLIEGTWRTGLKYFGKLTAVEVYKIKVEEQRGSGEVIAAGRIYDMKTGSLIAEIAGSKVVEKGELPDVLADKPEAAKKGLIETARDLIVGE